MTDFDIERDHPNSLCTRMDSMLAASDGLQRKGKHEKALCALLRANQLTVETRVAMACRDADGTPLRVSHRQALAAGNAAAVAVIARLAKSRFSAFSDEILDLAEQAKKLEANGVTTAKELFEIESNKLARQAIGVGFRYLKWSVDAAAKAAAEAPEFAKRQAAFLADCKEYRDLDFLPNRAALAARHNVPVPVPCPEVVRAAEPTGE